jgi:hypothetical protein
MGLEISPTLGHFTAATNPDLPSSDNHFQYGALVSIKIERYRLARDIGSEQIGMDALDAGMAGIHGSKLPSITAV